MLADHQDSFQKLGYLFGRNMALSWQAHSDLQTFKNTKSDPFSLICAPLMFHLEYDISYYEKLMMDVDKQLVDYRQIREIVNSGPGIAKTEELHLELTTNALSVLDNFSESEAKAALVNIIKSM